MEDNGNGNQRKTKFNILSLSCWSRFAKAICAKLKRRKYPDSNPNCSLLDDEDLPSTSEWNCRSLVFDGLARKLTRQQLINDKLEIIQNVLYSLYTRIYFNKLLFHCKSALRIALKKYLTSHFLFFSIAPGHSQEHP